VKKKQNHLAYGRARHDVLAAQERLAHAFTAESRPPGPPADDEPGPVAAARRALTAAETALSAAGEDLADEHDAAWTDNQQAIQDAAAAVKAALAHRIEVETGVADALRRDHRRAVTDDEAARCWQAREEWLAAKDTLAEAQTRFKQGVTAEQLDDHETGSR
jgi:hypothetical protein